MSRVSALLHGGPITSEDVSGLQSKLMFDRVPVGDRFTRFLVLAALSTIIAAYGVTRNSAATVIGAMIVAPLMTPIMAISLGAITGDTRNIIPQEPVDQRRDAKEVADEGVLGTGYEVDMVEAPEDFVTVVEATYVFVVLVFLAVSSGKELDRNWDPAAGWR